MNTTQGLLDSASIHSSLAALSIRNRASAWDHQCLLKATYLLLFDSIGMAPGPGTYRGASGPLKLVVEDHPFLGRRAADQHVASRWTLQWLTKRPHELRAVWDEIQSDPDFHSWASVGRELFWLIHVQMHHSLFNAEYVPYIAELLNCSKKELTDIEAASRSTATVKDWIRRDLASADAQLAHSAYIAAALIRGRHHEYAAAQTKTHVFHHPLRHGVGRDLPIRSTQPVYASEDYFVKALVGCALQETTAARRVKAWSSYVQKARNAIDLRRVSLPNSAIDSDAERSAAEAIRQCGIDATYARVRRELDVMVALGTSALLSLALSPWGAAAGPFLTQAYRHSRGASVGDDIAKAAFNTTKRFRRLARSVPGRIERPLKRAV